MNRFFTILKAIKIGLAVCFLAPVLVKAQLNNEAFYMGLESDSIVGKQFTFQLEHLNYLKNNEYFTKIADGRTMFGYQVIPKITYTAHPKLRLEAGAFLLKDYGNKGFRQIEPVFTARFMAGTNQVLMGTLDGGLEHNLVEPLYDFENQMLRRLENGFQWKHKSNGLKLDAWVDWRNMIYPNSSDQEEIVGGLNVEPILYHGKRTKLAGSFQGNVYHKGGQIDTSSLPLKTWFNGAAGFKLRTIPGHGIILKYLEIQGYGLGFLDNSNQKDKSNQKGNAWYFNASAKTLWFEIMVSYWKGRNFNSFQGGALYRSFSSNTKNPDYSEKNRELVFIRLMKDWEIMPNIWITARIEPYFDLKNNLMEFSHGLYINYRGELWKSKSKN